MTSRDFCYWLQGYFEITQADSQVIAITEDQVKMIQKHLSMVFYHEIDPSMGDKPKQDALSNIHGNQIVRC